MAENRTTKSLWACSWCGYSQNAGLCQLKGETEDEQESPAPVKVVVICTYSYRQIDNKPFTVGGKAYYVADTAMQLTTKRASLLRALDRHVLRRAARKHLRGIVKPSGHEMEDET